MQNVQLDNMRMPEELQILNLSLDPPRHVAADELLARDDFQGHLLVGDAVHGQLDLPEGALAERLDDLVSAYALLGLLLRRRRRLLVASSMLVVAAAVVMLLGPPMVGRLVLGAAVCGGGEGDLQLAVLVCTAGHHRGGRDAAVGSGQWICCFFLFGG